MNIQHILSSVRFAAFALLTAVVAACASSQKHEHISISPSPCEIAPQANQPVNINLQVNVPRKYFSKRSRLVIAPRLIGADGSVIGDLSPMVLDAKIFSKKQRRKVLMEGYKDPYAGIAQTVDRKKAIRLQYNEQFQLPENYVGGRIDATVSADGCGSCSGIEELTMATIAAPEQPVQTAAVVVKAPESLGLQWMEPQFVVRPKVMQGQGTAHMQFVINKYDIVPTLGNNARELEDMVSKLQPILDDTLATVTGISIYGMASADGPLSFNTPLSANRAKAAKEWLVERLQLPASIASNIRTGSRPEGWQPVLDAMTAAGNRDSVKVKDILIRFAASDDDVQERYIRRLPCWPVIRDNYLQKDRKVDYTYSWVIRSFTQDAELIAMYKIRPDAFNEDELLRVAHLTVDDASREQVYRYTLSRYPRSLVAANNLAIILERQGRYEEARQIFESVKQQLETK